MTTALPNRAGLGVRANPPSTSTPSQKPLLRLLGAAGSWLEGTAWSQAWVRAGEASGTCQPAPELPKGV